VWTTFRVILDIFIIIIQNSLQGQSAFVFMFQVYSS